MSHSSIISFPGLGIGEFSVKSVAFTLPFGDGIDIAWYALIITFGMICCLLYVLPQARKIGVTLDDIIDYALVVIPLGVIGARLYYVIFDTKHTYIVDDPIETIVNIFNIRQGGLAIYGAIIAGAIAVLGVSIVKKINFFAIGDCAAPAVLLAQGIGRWGNFMNGEAFGSETDWFCRMGLRNGITYDTFDTTEMVFVHPTFLYESLWNLTGVLLVYLFARFIQKKYDGQLILLTFGWYGLGRMFIEGLRTDSLMIGDTGIRVSQALAGALFFVCLVLLIVLAIVKPKVGYYFKYPVAAGVKLPQVSLKERFIQTFHTAKTAENEKPINYKVVMAKFEEENPKEKSKGDKLDKNNKKKENKQ